MVMGFPFVDWSKEGTNQWTGLITRFVRDKVLTGMHVENPEKYKAATLSIGGMHVNGHITSQGRLLFWDPFRLPVTLLFYHNVEVLLMTHSLETDEPNLHVEWDSANSHEKLPGLSTINYPVWIHDCPNHAWMEDAPRGEEEKERHMQRVRRDSSYTPCDHPVNNIFIVMNGMGGFRFAL